MAEQVGYTDWRSVDLAIKDAARTAARAGGTRVAAAAVDARVRQARYDRFLCRVFAPGAPSGWMLKGGMSMLARVPASRTTRDLDLAAPGGPGPAEAARELAALVGVDLGDHLVFRLARTVPTGLGENQPGVQTRRLVFDSHDAGPGRRVDTVAVDLVVGPAPVGAPEVVEPANRLTLRRPLPSSPYRLYPVADQAADKVCATLVTYAGRPSSRVKDLVDLVVLATTQHLDGTELQAAIEAKRARGDLGPASRLVVPEGWSRTWTTTARGVPAADGLGLAQAAALVGRLVDPALRGEAAGSGWSPQRRRWERQARA